MAALMRRESMDARWPWHQRSAPIGAMNSVCEIFRRGGITNDYGFDPVSGGLTDSATGQAPAITLLYRGKVRAANNKDWRARTRTTRGESGTVHAVRFQIPLHDSPPVFAHDIIRMIDSTPAQDLTLYVFHVRNPMVSSNAWVRNLLCDVDVTKHDDLPEPFTAEVIGPELLPEPVQHCTIC